MNELLKYARKQKKTKQTKIATISVTEIASMVLKTYFLLNCYNIKKDAKTINTSFNIGKLKKEKKNCIHNLYGKKAFN